MGTDMKDRHSDMITRRAERYRERASKMTMSSTEQEEFNQLLEDYTAKEMDMMESRLNSKKDRMRPSGDMRDPEVKEKFKADLRRSIDERKETDKATRDELRELRRRIDDILLANPMADL